MIKIENVEDFGWEAAIRGMRNPMNSWAQSDSVFDFDGFMRIGNKDLDLMQSLSKAGDDHGKYLRMINVTLDITAPLYWWKEFDTYKVGTVANSCSTMHKIHAKEFTLDDFSCERLSRRSLNALCDTVEVLNDYRRAYVDYKDGDLYIENDGRIMGKSDLWWQMIQLLPSSYNQRRTVQLNYQVLKAMHHARKNHKLDEWRTFCAWCETLPYFKELCIDVENDIRDRLRDAEARVKKLETELADERYRHDRQIDWYLAREKEKELG